MLPSEKTFNIQEYQQITDSELKRVHQERLISEEQKADLPPVHTPQLYAFVYPALEEKNPGLNAVKVGDTHHSDHTIRTNQWKKVYGDISVIGNADAFFDYLDPQSGYVQRVYFRDYAVHKFLEEHGYEYLRHRYKRHRGNFVLPTGKETISEEFFVPKEAIHPVSQTLLVRAQQSIKKDYEEGNHTFKTYSPSTYKRSQKGENVNYRGLPEDTFAPYTYQKEASIKLADQFLQERNSTYPNKVILDAPTRSGKSYMLFWALKRIILLKDGLDSDESFSSSVFCQKANNLIVITSAIPDVFDEFKRVVEQHSHFKSDFVWIEKSQLLADPDLIEKLHRTGNNNLVLALSLQDLAGRTSSKKKDLKEIHKLIDNKVTYVVGDECHYAMFGSGESYKAALQQELEVNVIDDELKKGVVDDITEGGKAAFNLNPTYGFIFSSATTYGVLGTESFDQETDVTFVSAQTIQEETDSLSGVYANPLDSPFYGRPRKHYFGVDLSAPANEIFKATEDGFIYYTAVRNIVESLFGVKCYEHLPSLFSNDVLKQAGAGRHIVFQMPSKKACDALDKLLVELDLGYHVYNISSSKEANPWTQLNAIGIKSEIQRRRWEKTITITVNRLVTGVSVPEWDTVVLANSGQSLVRRIQTYGRVETPRVEDISESEEVQEKTKYCLKPNCFVIDFNPEQLYEFCNQSEIHSRKFVHEASERTDAQINPLPSGNICTYDGLTMHKMTREDVHKQLKEYFSGRTINKLVETIDPLGELVINDSLRELITISGGNKQNIKITLGQSQDQIAERDGIAGREKVEPTATLPSEPEKEDGEKSSADGVVPTPEAIDVSVEYEKDKKRRNYIYQRILLFTAITQTADNLQQLLNLIETD